MSPYASEAQRRKMHQLAKEGKIDQSVIDKLDDESAGKKLPERKHPPKEQPKESKPEPSHPHEVIHETLKVLNQ